MDAGDPERPIGRNRLAVIVGIEIAAGWAAAFRPMIEANAADSLRLEPGCLRFDVLACDDGAAPQVVLYEVYTDRAAFDRHLTMPHYLRFEDDSHRMIMNKAVRFFTFCGPLHPEEGAPG